MSKAINNCRICGSTEFEPVIDLGMQALTGMFPKSLTESIPTEPLDLVRCVGGCGLVQLRHSCPPALMYGANYGYRSGLNPSMVAHLRDLASDARARVGLSPGDLILDIGSNDGTLMKAMTAHGVTITGMDPTADKFRQFYPPEASVIPELFSAARFRREYGSRKAKVVTSVAMFYDLEAPTQFMKEVAEVLADDGIWVFEQSYLPSMIERNSYDTICHEHLEYYCLSQIMFMAERSGLEVADVSFNDSNGGSFRVIATHAHHKAKPSPSVEAALVSERAGGYGETEPYDQFRRRVLSQTQELEAFLGKMGREGQKVFGYGASTKGNVILQYCGITPEYLPAIAEVNPDKYGSFTPGTLIPIISEQEAKSQKPDAFLVLPWHFRDFIVEKEQTFLEQGGRLVFPLPSLETITEKNLTERMAL